MTVGSLLLYGAGAALGVALVIGTLRLSWLILGAYRIRRAGPRRLLASQHTIWQDPGVVESLDLSSGPGGPDGAPVPPFSFIEEHSSGSQPCVSVTDGRGRRWRVKWGQEVRAENFAVRLVWACGYHAETTYFVGSGAITGAHSLQRASSCIAADCSFHDARFELDDPAVRKLFEEHSWAWNDNPFVGTPQLNGLKVLVMLLADWDTKDRRDVARGSNTAIFEHRVGRWRREARYLITDWGGSMGRWGGNIVTRGRWDPEGFEAQNVDFVKGTNGGLVQFGYVGQRTADVAANIPVEHVRWLCGFLGRINDAQLREALAASGASRDDTDHFTRALRGRIDVLKQATAATPIPSAPAPR
jgi:hypothetical protein